MDFIERLQYYMSEKDINDNKLTVDAGLSVGLIGKAKKTGKAMTSANIEKILLAYPELNPEWLLTGKGSMIKEQSASTLNLNNTQSPKPIETRPRIPFDAAAGSLSIVTQSATESQCELRPVNPSLPDYDFSILVKGDSMEPDFRSGDEIACKLRRTNSSFIRWGEPYVIDSHDGVVLKRIFDNGDSIRCHSNNPAYPDFTIPKSEINRMALVVGMIRLF